MCDLSSCSSFLQSILHPIRTSFTSGIPSVPTAGCRAVIPGKSLVVDVTPMGFSQGGRCSFPAVIGSAFWCCSELGSEEQSSVPPCLWRCLLQSHSGGLFLNFHPTLTPGQGPPCAVPPLPNSPERGVPAAADSFPQRLVKASSAISAILLSVYV